VAIITISRGSFAGGQKLAECVAEKLGYRCVSREVLAEAAKQYGVAEDKLYKSLVEKPKLLERLTLERTHYTAFIRAALCREVKGDNVVYHGHAGHLLLRGVPHVLRVRVVADMELRIRAAMEAHGMNREDAIAYIEDMDRARAKWTKFLYHVDWCDPDLYDLVINLDHIGLSTACEILSTVANLEEFQTTAESQRTMDDLALSSEVRARIAADGGVGDAEIEVEASAGVVTILGTLNSIEEADKVRAIAKKTPGVTEVVSKMQVRTHW
jgi:osmotically-inducible protein OsmY